MRILLLPMVVMMATLSTNAQSKADENYKKESAEMRSQVWAWDKPEFKVRAVPAEYAKASKVILAHHTELTADVKSIFKFYVLTFGVKKEQTLTEITRELIKLNDKNAVADYSEFSFVQFQKVSGFSSLEKVTTYVGVRVIKPNGTIKEIDADDIVTVTNSTTQKKSKDRNTRSGAG